MRNEVFIIPEEVKPEFKFSKWFYGIDLFVVVGFYLIFDTLKGFVYDVLYIPYIIIALLFGLVLTRKSRSNPDKRIATSFFYWLIKKRDSLEFHRLERGENS